jgi:uncharacterized protein (DUF983 family)
MWLCATPSESPLVNSPASRQQKELSKARMAGSETPYLLVLDRGACYRPSLSPLTQVVRWFSRQLQGLPRAAEPRASLGQALDTGRRRRCTRSPAGRLFSDCYRQGSFSVPPMLEQDMGLSSRASRVSSRAFRASPHRPLGLLTLYLCIQILSLQIYILTYHVSLLHGWRPACPACSATLHSATRLVDSSILMCGSHYRTMGTALALPANAEIL